MGLERMLLRQVAVSLFVAVALAGCSGVGSSQKTQQSQFSSLDFSEEQIWLRTDGQTGRNNPELAAKFVADRTACVTGEEARGPLIPNI